LSQDDREYLEHESEELIQRLIERKSIVDNQNKEVVKRLVRECVENAAKSIESQLKELEEEQSPQPKKSRKEFQGLKEIIYGICDGDNKANNSPIENVFYTQLYSYENYLLNPINLFLVAKHALSTNSDLVKEIQDSNGDLKNISNKELLCKRDLLQSILDTITEKLVTFANGKFPTLIDLINKNDLDHTKFKDTLARKEREIAKEVNHLYLSGEKTNKVPITQFLKIETHKKDFKSLKIKSNKEQVKFQTENGEIALEIEKFLCYMKGKHLQYFYESDPQLFAQLKSKLKDVLNMSESDPFSRLALAYIRKYSNDECLFLMPSEFSTEIFGKF